MNFLQLPQEILTEIAKKLDPESLLCLWETCETMRATVRDFRVMHQMKIFNFDKLTKLPGFVDLAGFVSELDFNGSPNLRSEDIEQVMSYFTNVTSLNVSNTDISMWDAAKICELCKTLVNLEVKFSWPNFGDCQYGGRQMVEACQSAFRRLEQVSFLSNSDEILKCGHIFHVLQLCSNITVLNIKLLRNDNIISSYYHFDCLQSIPPSLRVFSLIICEDLELSPYNQGLLFELFRNSEWESLTARYTNEGVKLELTEQIMERAKKMPELSQWVVPVYNELRDLREIRRFTAWHKDLQTHQVKLFDNIVQKLYKQIPHKICKTKESLHQCGEFYCISPCVFPLKDLEGALPDKCTFLNFNIDSSLKPTHNLRLSMEPWCGCYQERKEETIQIGFVPSNKLSFLTYLSIVNCLLHSSFKNVFMFCNQLKTFRYIKRSPCLPEYSCVDVIKEVHMSKSIQFLTIVDYNTSMDMLVQVIKNSTLQGICLGGKNDDKKINTDSYTELIHSCPSLCYLNLHFQSVVSNVHDMWKLKRFIIRIVDSYEPRKNMYVRIDNKILTETDRFEYEFGFHDVLCII